MMGKALENGNSPNSSNLKILPLAIRSVVKMGSGWLRGMSSPHPFFKLDHEPIVGPKVLTKAERETLAETVKRNFYESTKIYHWPGFINS